MVKDIAVCREVYDGDSFRIETAEDKTDRIRLLHVDCPKGNTVKGAIATRTLSELILNKAINYEGEVRDAYGRLLAEVWISDMARTVNEHMISQGCRRV